MPIQAAPFKFFEKYEGFPRSLKFDMNALADFEQETGMGFGQLMQQKAIFAVVRGLLWAGFQHEDRRIQMRRVGELISQYLEDETESHDINDLLVFAYQTAVEQGAFGVAEDFEKKARAKMLTPALQRNNDSVTTDNEPRTGEILGPGV
jgi:hypothetical protein